MSISVVCEQCKKHYRVPESKAGKTIHCPNCKGPVQIPALTSQASTSPPSAPASPPKQSPPQPPPAPAPNAAYPSQAYPAASYQQYPAQPYPAPYFPPQGQQPYPAAPYPQSPAQYPAQAFPTQPYPMPQAPQAYPTQPYPAQPYPVQSYPPSPYPGQAYPPQSYPGQPVQAYPMSPQAGVPAGVGGLLGTLGQMDASANAGSPFPAPAASSPYGIGGGGMASLPSYGPARRPGKSVASFLASHFLVIMVAILALIQFIAILAQGAVVTAFLAMIVPGLLVGGGLLPKTERINMTLIRIILGLNIALFACRWLFMLVIVAWGINHFGMNEVDPDKVGRLIGAFLLQLVIFTVVWSILYLLMKLLGCINVLCCVYLLANVILFFLIVFVKQLDDTRSQENPPPRFSQTITVPDLPHNALALGGP